jgi:hypothetical protein
MGDTAKTKRKKKGKSMLYFFAITTISTAVCFFIIKEGQRIKTENELLAYEVW